MKKPVTNKRNASNTAVTQTQLESPQTKHKKMSDYHYDMKTITKR
jgi:hypothetical protein